MYPYRIAFALALSLAWWPTVRSADPAGALVIVGGGKFPTAVRAEFFKLAGGPGKARIVVIPTASETADDPKATEASLKGWRDLKPAAVQVVHTRERKAADDPAFTAPLRDATAVWFGGGDQNKIIAAYRGTLVEKELRKVLDRGGVIGGTSAGAAIMSGLMIQGGTAEARTGPGFGFVPGVVVDQHFVARDRIGRLRGVLGKNPTLVGLGVDEATAAVVRGDTVTVLGDGTVTAIAARSAAAAGEEKVYKAGEKIDLAALRPVTPAKSR
ncbi:cyanophycinase [Limnoglobus roseus]|uniref:Cyanophycinase n=2 Tax=Limnoglobus roseus TaxID=2598579 RepID=A0A5C1AIL2_9BACT|nr:cyanophycinase [Limnoglobus roseus]